MTGQCVTFSRLGDAELVRLAGEIDLANSGEIGKAIVDRRKSPDETPISASAYAGVL